VLAASPAVLDLFCGALISMLHSQGRRVDSVVR
jgi:hypothetical protein